MPFQMKNVINNIIRVRGGDVDLHIDVVRPCDNDDVDDDDGCDGDGWRNNRKIKMEKNNLMRCDYLTSGKIEIVIQRKGLNMRGKNSIVSSTPKTLGCYWLQ